MRSPTSLARRPSIPGNDRAWYSLGAAQNELERTIPARRNLHAGAQAATPTGAGYEGELGTAAKPSPIGSMPRSKRSSGRLQANPSDYVALTGIGLLRLKQGRPQQALDALAEQE